MKSYILEKISGKAFGPFDTKEDANAELARVLELIVKSSQEIFRDVEVNITEQIDDWVVTAGGKTIAKYEVIEKDQFDHPENIPEEFQ